MQTNSVIVIIMKSTYTVCIQSDVGKGKKTEMSSCVDGFVVSAQLNSNRFQVETKRVRRVLRVHMYGYVFACHRDRRLRCRRRRHTIPYHKPFAH